MSDTEERLKKARGLLEAGNAEEGRIVLLELLKDEPNNATALLMLGGAYFYEKKYAEADEQFQRALRKAYFEETGQ